MPVHIAPSILGADMARLGEEVARVAGADWVHVDVMDNHFVPNLGFGPGTVEAVSRCSGVPIDGHLMVTDPERCAVDYIDAGCSSVTFHAEATRAPIRLARDIRARGSRAGLAVCPATPVESYEPMLDEFDLLLIMTIDPGFGGQSFMDLCLDKIRTARRLIDMRGSETLIQVDGGISLMTIERCAEAGADVFVAGTAIYSADEPAEMIERLRNRAESARSGSPCSL